MESQKIINILEDDNDDNLKFQTKKWYIINDQNNRQYGKGDENDSTIKFNTEVIKPFLVDYSDSYILFTGDIAVASGDNNTEVCFKNYNVFIRSVIHLNDEHIETAEHLNLAINLYNLIEYSDNYEQSSGFLWKYKSDEQPLNNAGDIIDVTVDNSSSFKYKSNLLKGLTTRNVAANLNPNIANTHRLFVNAIDLKNISSFFRSLELPLINTKLHIELNWTKDSVMSNVAANNSTTFQIKKTELYVPVVSLSTNDNLTLTKLFSKEFKRSVFWNEYKSKIQAEIGLFISGCK